MKELSFKRFGNIKNRTLGKILNPKLFLMAVLSVWEWV